ncbi:MAG: ABC transporter permease, partial [Anaerolineae bacterium]
RENLTYEMLVATPLKPRTILWGKLLSAMSYVLLLIIAAIPLASLVFIFGGVAPADALKALLMLAVTAITFGVVGLFFSALTGRTARATVLSYSFLLLVSVGTLFLFIAWGIIQNAEPPRAILLLNPFSGMASVLAEAMPRGGPFSIREPLSALAGDLRFVSGRSDLTSIRPTWHFTLALYTALSLSLYLVSTQLVKPIRRWRIGRLGAAVVILLLLLFGLGGYVLSRPVAGAAEGIAVPTPDSLIVPAAPVRIERAVPVPYPYPPVPTPTPAVLPKDAP